MPIPANAAVRGGLDLAFDAVDAVTDIVEGMHRNIATPVFFAPPTGRARGIAGFVYACVRGANGLVRDGTRFALAPVPNPAPEARESWLAALNGVLGDHLQRSGNPLAIPMRLRSGGRSLTLERDVLRAAFPAANDHVLILAHGLCMSDLQWTRTRNDGSEHNHGYALAEVLGCTPLWLHYNSGCHVAENGRNFASLLTQLDDQWPVPLRRITMVGHSMGGLVIRSAVHAAAECGAPWLSKVDRAVYLGSPHHGASLERVGNRFQAAVAWSRYSAPLSALGAIRSAGITDLRHGNVVDADPDRFTHHNDRRRTVPLAVGIEHYAVAATLSSSTEGMMTDLLGDGLVHPASATGRHRDKARDLGFAPGNRLVVPSTAHMALLSNRAVFSQLTDWLSS